MNEPGLRYRRVVLKISGEALGPGAGRGVRMSKVRRIAGEVKEAHDAGAELVIVVGGGNLIRGRKLVKEGVDASTADSMGMLGTVINGIALGVALTEKGVDTRVLSAIGVGVVESYDRLACLRHLRQGRVVVCVGGTGNPHFTTDTGAALRAREVGAEAVLKATNVDGVYSDDPRKDPKAKRYRRLTYDQVIRQDLKVMDMAAFALCREGSVPILVFDLSVKGGVLRALRGEDLATFVGDK